LLPSFPPLHPQGARLLDFLFAPCPLWLIRASKHDYRFFPRRAYFLPRTFFLLTVSLPPLQRGRISSSQVDEFAPSGTCLRGVRFSKSDVHLLLLFWDDPLWLAGRPSRTPPALRRWRPLTCERPRFSPFSPTCLRSHPSAIYRCGSPPLPAASKFSYRLPHTSTPPYQLEKFSLPCCRDIIV